MKRNNFVGAALLAMALSAISGLAAGAATIIKIATVAPDGTAPPPCDARSSRRHRGYHG